MERCRLFSIEIVSKSMDMSTKRRGAIVVRRTDLAIIACGLFPTYCSKREGQKKIGAALSTAVTKKPFDQYGVASKNH